MYNEEILQLNIRSSLDGTEQPSLFYQTKGTKRPLLIDLHTWSYDRFNQVENMLPYAKKYAFNLLLPEFRGPNTMGNPHYLKACGSKYAVQDMFTFFDKNRQK